MCFGGFYISCGRIKNLTLLPDKPFCKPDQVQVYGVAKREKIRVTCDVISNPSVNLKFEWVFNSSSERLDLQENLIEVRGTRSLAHHMPQVREFKHFYFVMSQCDLHFSD